MKHENDWMHFKLCKSKSQKYIPIFFQAQWHLNGGARGGFDMNVQPAWDRGFTGKGVVVTILDDGIQTNHPELRDNYDPQVNKLGM